MLWTEELFGVKKPILAMLHLDALPGDPRFRRGTPLGEIVEHARADLHALQDGGVDGIIFSNEFSFPYQRKMDMVTPAAMAYIIGALRSEIRVPFGVDAISDGAACLELAAAVGARYVRGTFSGVYVGDGGLYNNDFSALLRRKAALPLDDLKMLYFINPESDRNLDTRPLACGFYDVQGRPGRAVYLGQRGGHGCGRGADRIGQGRKSRGRRPVQHRLPAGHHRP